MTSPRWGILAGHGVDGEAWQQSAMLPQGPRWQRLQQTGDCHLIDLDGLVWLWKPGLDDEHLKLEQRHFLGWARAVIQARQNRLVPIILVAAEPVSTLPDVQRHEALHWLTATTEHLKRLYQRELQGWAPPALVDVSRITLEASGLEAGRRVADAIERLNTTIAIWQRQTHRRAGRCLAAGLVLTMLYLSVLISTLFWKGTSTSQEQSRELVRWSPTEWKYHVSDCRQLLDQLQGRSFEQLAVPEQLRFTEHLRWLPISLDVLEQRRPTKEVQRWRGEVQELLSQMEALLEKWSPESNGAITEQVALQSRTRQLLEGVFEPRRPPTVLNRLASRYWQGERRLLVAQLMATRQGTPEQAACRWAMINLLKERLTLLEKCRVHAPELQAGLLQEMQSSITWLETASARGEKTDTGQPPLLVEASVVP